ncbi:MAG TPA: PAS domain S-box protein, partial [Geobacteraceae bacterium]
TTTEGLEERVTVNPRSDVADIAAAFNRHMEMLANKEQQLADKNQLLSSILDTASVGICAFDRAGTYTLVNRAYCQLSGYEESEVIGQPLTFVLPPEIHDEALRLHEAYCTGTIDAVPPVWEGVCKDGSRKTVSIQTSRLRLKDNDVMVIAVIQDISERKRVEAERLIKDRAIASSLNGVAISDLDGNVTFANASFLAMWGYDTLQEILGRKVVDFWQSPEEARAALVSLHESGSWRGTRTAVRKDGTTFIAEISGNLVRDESGAPLCQMASFLDVTDRIMSETALKKSEEKFAKTFWSAPSLIAITRIADGMIIDVNDAFLRAFGYDRDDLVGHTTGEIGFWPSLVDRTTVMEEVQQRGGVREREVATKNKNGDDMWILFSCESIEIESEPCLITTLNDITARRRAEEELRASEERFRSLVELAVDAILQGDPEGNIIGANESATLLTGYRREELLGMHIRRMFTAEELERAPLRFDLLKAGKEVRVVRRLSRKDGSTVPIEMNTKMMPDGSYQAFFRDISERTSVEEALRTSEERYRTLFESASDPIIILRDGCIVECNQRALKLFGCNAEQLLGHPPQDFSPPVQPDGLDSTESARQKIEAALAGVPQHYEWRLRHTDGTETDVEAILNRLESGNGYELMAIGRDVTKRKKAEDALREARDAADAANRAKSEFFANISHEIRTPLTAIIGFADLIQTTEDRATQKRYLEMIITSGEILQYLVKDILDLARIESGRLELDIAPFSLAETIARSSAAQEVIARQKGVMFTTAIDPSIPDFLVGDAEHLRQILANLVSNAVKFTHEGEISLSVTRLASVAVDSGTGLHFVVRDTGIGIPPEKQHQIFESFTQADGSTSRKYGGFGLGTTIAKKLVDLMGGRIWLESSPGAGSTFHVAMELPVASREDAEVLRGRQMSSWGRATMPQYHGKPLRVLLAEDNEFNQHLIADALKGLGHGVTVAKDGKGAVELFLNNGFDLILMDVQMPGMNGLEATREIRRLEQARGGHTPIIAITAGGRPEDRARCLAAGMDHFLTKPVSITDLLQEIFGCGQELLGFSDKELTRTADADQGLLLRHDVLPAALRKAGADLRRYAQLLCNDLDRTLDRIEQALGDRDRAELARAAHTLKGIAAPLVKDDISRLAVELEDSAALPTLERAAELLRLLRKEYLAIASSPPGQDPRRLT